MDTKKKSSLGLPVLVDCWPTAGGPEPDGKATWVSPTARALVPVRRFTRADVDGLANQLSDGQRQHYLSLLTLLNAVARDSHSNIRTAQERLDRAFSMMKTEREKLADGLAATAEVSAPLNLHTQSGDTITFDRNALLQLSEEVRSVALPTIDADADPKRVLSSQVTSLLHRAQLVLWFDDAGRMRPALYCGSDALVAAIARTVLGEGLGWELCQNCWKFFRKTRDDQKWCSTRCGNAARVRKSQSKSKNPDIGV